MDLNAQRKRNSIVIWFIFLLIAALLFGLHRHDQKQAFNQVALHQQLLTSQTAARLQDRLTQISSALSLLAADPGSLLADRSAAVRQLRILFQSLPEPGLSGLLLMDASGNLLIDYPPGELVAGDFPVHLLKAAAAGAFTCETVDCNGNRILLLRQAAGPETDTVFIALVSLPNLLASSLQPAGGQAEFGFLLDDGGKVQLHDRPEMVGHSLRQLTSGLAGADVYDVVAAFSRGYYVPDSGDWSGSPRFPAALLAGGQDPRLPRTTLLTGAPVQVAGARWSLALAMPAATMAELDRGNIRFAIVLSVLLLAAMVVSSRFAGLLQLQPLLLKERRLRRSDKARMQQELDLAARRYRHLFDNAGDAIFFIDPASGALLEVNRQAEDLLGYQAEEIRTLSLAVLFPARNHLRYLRLVARVLRHGYGEESNLVFRCKKGRLFTGAVHARLGDLGDRQVVHGVLRDITGLKRIEQELRQKNRDLLLMNEIADHAAASRDLREMAYPILNKVVRGFGFDGGGLVVVEEDTRRLRLVAHQDIEDAIRKEIEVLEPGEGLLGRVAASGQSTTSFDLENDPRVGSESARLAGWASFQAVPLTANDRPVGVLFLFGRSKRVLSRSEVSLLEAIGKQVGTAVAGGNLFAALARQVRLTQASNLDLEHSRRQLRDNLQQMEEANRALAQLDRMKSNFLALASHELRTPLTYILSGTELLTSQLRERLQESETRVLEAVYEGGKRLQEIVDDLLEVARIESRTLYLAREKIELIPLLTEVAEEFTPLLLERQLTFRLASFPDPHDLYGDSFHLRRTFRRLLENAIKFTPEGGWIQVDAALRTPADLQPLADRLSTFSPAFFAAPPAPRLLQLSIRDSGVGIDPEDQIRVFDKFYEIGEITDHSTSRTRFGGKGVGLGLTLVKGMVEAHGGMVWVDSAGTGESATGSAFHILLPLVSGTAISGEARDAAD